LIGPVRPSIETPPSIVRELMLQGNATVFLGESIERAKGLKDDANISLSSLRVRLCDDLTIDSSLDLLIRDKQADATRALSDLLILQLKIVTDSLDKKTMLFAQLFVRVCAQSAIFEGEKILQKKVCVRERSRDTETQRQGQGERQGEKKGTSSLNLKIFARYLSSAATIIDLRKGADCLQM
jgi:hypothetical protein